MKPKGMNGIATLIIVLIGVLLTGCSEKEEESNIRALFSWKQSAVLNEREILFSTMKECKLNTLYQEFSSELKEEEIITFLEEASKEQIDIYLLTGSPEWALEEDGASMIRQIKKVLTMNDHVSDKEIVKGVLFDVEPYLLEEWDTLGNQQVMDRYVKGMQAVYQEAKDSGLEVILCIPYFYDNKGVSKQLESLIRSSCDRIAIMNYYRGKEKENIEFEVSLAAKYKKKVINIYELQAPGQYDLQDVNTYYQEGIYAVEANYNAVRAAYRESTDIALAFHHFEALKEVMKRE